ncbi:MAG: hemolysin III family protein [Bacteroidota bacterium]
MKSLAFQEELANSLTHGFGVILSIVGIPILVSLTVSHGNPLHIWGVSIFCACLLMLYVFSTLYHSISNPMVKKAMRVMDHISIFFLIAGSYTPFIFFFMDRTSGYVFLGILWGLALLGTLFKIFFTGRFNLLSTAVYVCMGWLIIFIAKPIFSAMSFEGILWVAVGGAAYTLGVVFYLWHKLNFHHAIWHLFVLTGSVSHYIAVLYSLYFVQAEVHA